MDKKLMIVIICICIFLLVSGIIFVSSMNREEDELQNEIDILVPRAVMINDQIYIDTYKMSDITRRCGMLDGEIKFQVESDSMPKQNNESNFGINIGYQKVDENNIDLRFDDGWRRFTKL